MRSMNQISKPFYRRIFTKKLLKIKITKKLLKNTHTNKE